MTQSTRKIPEEDPVHYDSLVPFVEAHENRSGEAEAEDALVEQVKQSADQLRGMLTFVKPWSLHWQLWEASLRELKGHQCAPQDGVVYM